MVGAGGRCYKTADLPTGEDGMSGRDATKESLAEKLPAKKILYVHCRSGARARTAAGLLKKQGYDARPLKSGFEDLVQAGFTRAK